MIYLLINLCEDYRFLRIIYLINVIVKLLSIAVPIILIVTLMIEFIKAIINSDDAKIKAVQKSAINRIIAAVVVFLVPTFISMFLSILNSNEYQECVKDISLEKINELKKQYNDEKELQYMMQQDILRQNQEKYNNYLKSLPKAPNNSSYSNNDNAGSVVKTSNGEAFTSTKNGITYNLYNQSDSRWGETTYPSGSTISGIGCMITSASVISSAGDSSVTPLTVFNNARHDYPSSSIPTLSKSSFTCTFSASTDLKEELLKGNVAVIMVYGNNKGGSSNFTSSQHYMALLDYDEGTNRIFVGNSYGNGTGYGANGWFDADSVLTSVIERHICTPTKSLLDRFKSNTGNNNNNNYGGKLSVSPGIYERSYSNMKYHEVIPPNPKEGMPLIIFLHGDGEANNFAGIKNIAVVRKVMNGELSSNKYIFIAPLSASGTWYSTTSNYDNLKNVIDHVVDEYKIDKNRIYINGFSGGAIATWTMVDRNPGFFKAAVPVSCCPQGVDVKNFISTSIYALVGTKDYETNFMSCMKNFVDQINSNGGSAKYQELPGQNHAGAQSTYPTESLFNWILSQ